MTDPLRRADLEIVPANEASWADLVAIFGTADYPYCCQCQRWKVTGWLWRDTSLEQRVAMHRAATACGKPPRPRHHVLAGPGRRRPRPVMGRHRGRGYPMVTEPGREITWGELHVGAVQVFEDAGFVPVSAPTKRRRVVRIDFPG